jgi:TetR/AcrR family transcriptional repressor of nem operon
MPWEKTYNEEDVLTRAMEAFWARGYEATSMSDLVKATGINRGSMYAAFTDKRNLFIRALTYYDRRHREEYLRNVRANNAPRDAIITAFEDAIAATGDGTDRRGCLLVNTSLELSPHDAEIDGIVRASFTEVEGFFHNCIEDGQAAGEIDRSIDPSETARALLGLFIGLRVLMRSRPEPGVMTAIVAQAKEIARPA